MKPVVINPDGKRQTVKLKEAIAHMNALHPYQNIGERIQALRGLRGSP